MTVNSLRNTIMMMSDLRLKLRNGYLIRTNSRL